MDQHTFLILFSEKKYIHTTANCYPLKETTSLKMDLNQILTMVSRSIPKKS